MANNDLGKIRRSAIIYNAAPGAIVDFRADGAPISAVIAGLDAWDTYFRPAGVLNGGQVVFEERLQKKLGVAGFRLPPVRPQENYKKDSKAALPALAATRFPNWLQCPKCGMLGLADRWTKEFGRPWRKCPICDIFVIPVRFVMACQNGHLDEFP